MDFLANDRQTNTTSTFHILSRCTSSYLYEYNTDTGLLKECSARPPLSRCAAATHNNLLYIVGGLRNNTISDVGLIYDIEKRLWREYNCPIKKAFCEVCAMHDKMYLFGGINSAETPQNSCSCYDFHTDRWTNLPSMKHFRGAPAVFYYDSSIYITGGFSASDNRQVERFDPREGVWSGAGSISIFGVLSSAVVRDTAHILNSYSGRYCQFDPRNLTCTPDSPIPFAGKTWLGSMQNKLHVIHDEGIDMQAGYNEDWTNVLKFRFEKCPFLIS